MQLIDIGVNLTSSAFAKDLEQVIEQANTAKLVGMILIGSDLEDSLCALELAKNLNIQTGTTVGVHPHQAKDVAPDFTDQIRALAKQDRVVALGEMGLDYNRNYSPPDAQREVFAAQLGLAEELDLPLYLHQRDAHQDFLALLKEYQDHFSEAVVHCFTGTQAELDDYLNLDMHIGITGWICDERRGQDLQESVKHIPDDKLMLETDAPYLLPRTIRPKPSSRRNEPAFLTYVLEKVAECRGQSVEEIAALTTANAKRFFNLA